MDIQLKLPGVRRALEAMPWAIERGKLQAVLELVELRAGGGKFTAEEVRARIGDPKPQPRSKTLGKIAVLPLYGVIAQRMDLFSEMSGGTSTQRFANDFDAAMADPDVGAIVIDVDSPGGNVAGTPELAARIYDARGQGKKIIAVANSLMASAAYWIGAAADELVASPSAMVGSIGVFTVHVDESAQDELIGLKYTIISAGKYKTEANPYEPLSPDAGAALQDWVDEYYTMFVNAVAKYRGVKAIDVRNGYGEGRVLTAKAALAAGMVDRVDTLEGTLRRLGAQNVGMDGKPRAGALPNRPAAAAADLAPGPIALALANGEPVEIEITGGRLRPAVALAASDAARERVDAARQAFTVETEPAADAGAAASLTADGAAAEVDPSSPSQRPTAAEEQPVDNPSAAAPANGAADLQTTLTAERERARSIRAIGQEHNIPADQIEAQIDNGATLAQAKAAFFDSVRAQRGASPRVRMGADREAERPFASFGDQMMAIIQAGMPTGRVDNRLRNVNQLVAGTPSGMSEGVGSDGGFFIQPDLLPGIIDPVYTDDPILSRVTRIPIGANSNGVKYNVVDETARTTGSRWGGIQMYWGSEADTATAAKPKLRQVIHDLKKLIGVAYLTDELTQDAPAAEALLTRAFQAELSFMLGIAIFNGTGAGQPLGMLKSGALVTQAIEGGQTIANTNQSIALNVSKMLSRVPASLWDQLIWLYNQELLPYLMTAVVGTGGAAVPVFLGAGGISGRPYDTILGRPAYASELCEAVGTTGDLLCVAPSQYHMSDKGGPQAAQSLHVRFLYDEMAFRITYRCDGQPVWKQAITPYKGANTRSPFVGLGTRT